MAREPSPLYLVFDGSALDRLLYRIVKRCPPVLDDFESYEARRTEYDRRDFFLGVGVSMYTARARAERVAQRFRRGRAIAVLDLRGAAIAWARTGRSRRHVTVWAPPDLLLGSVLQCDEL
jgi:hypothetical protein